jgi:hypothetical protein
LEQLLPQGSGQSVLTTERVYRIITQIMKEILCKDTRKAELHNSSISTPVCRGYKP